MRQQLDLLGGLFWSGAGLLCLAVFAHQMILGPGWVYYSGSLLFPGIAMLVVGVWLIRRSKRPRG